MRRNTQADYRERAARQKRRYAEFRVTGCDLLNQNRSFRQSTCETYVQSTTHVLRRIAMFSFSYTFDSRRKPAGRALIYDRLFQCRQLLFQRFDLRLRIRLFRPLVRHHLLRRILHESFVGELLQHAR